MMAASGTNAVYVAFEVNPSQAKEVAESIRTLGLSGVNLTVPFKESILPYLDELTLSAQQAGAVNAVALRDGRLIGHNTDGAGFLAAMHQEQGFSPSDKKCVILGSGGAARAIAASLTTHGASQIYLLNRTVRRAEQAIESLEPLSSSTELHASSLNTASFRHAAKDADLVVNCLGGGAEEAVLALPVEVLPEHAIWADINYWMHNPPQIEACAQRGIATSNGLGMLVHQGALSFEWFVDQSVPVEQVFEAVQLARTAEDPKQPELG